MIGPMIGGELAGDDAPMRVSGAASVSGAAPWASGALVLGIGNTLLRDEAAGARVIEALAAHGGLDGVELLDAGTLSFTLLGYLEAADSLIVVDAANLSAAPGTVRCLEGDAMDRFLSAADRRRSVHEVGLLDLLAIARLRDSLPGRRALVCVQPAEVAWGLTLTPAVQAAVGTAAQAVLDLLERWRCLPQARP